jgi:hypothetical protein
VRLEIEAAIRLNKPIVPILLEGAEMPSSELLPDSLVSLSYRQALELRHETFARDVERLEQGISELVTRHALEIAEPAREITVFVSHSTKDRDWVEKRIVGFLRRSNITPWYSSEEITSASQWEREILKGMESCDWFLIVVSPQAADSEWVKDELFWAMEHRPFRIVPIIKERCDLYKFHLRLPRIEHVDFTANIDSAERKLIKCLTVAK